MKLLKIFLDDKLTYGMLINDNLVLDMIKESALYLNKAETWAINDFVNIVNENNNADYQTYCVRRVVTDFAIKKGILPIRIQKLSEKFSIVKISYMIE